MIRYFVKYKKYWLGLTSFYLAVISQQTWPNHQLSSILPLSAVVMLFRLHVWPSDFFYRKIHLLSSKLSIWFFTVPPWIDIVGGIIWGVMRNRRGIHAEVGEAFMQKQARHSCRSMGGTKAWFLSSLAHSVSVYHDQIIRD